MSVRAFERVVREHADDNEHLFVSYQKAFLDRLQSVERANAAALAADQEAEQPAYVLDYRYTNDRLIVFNNANYDPNDPDQFLPPHRGPRGT